MTTPCHFPVAAYAIYLQYKSPTSDQIQAELIQAGGETLVSAIHKFINCIWKKEKLPKQYAS
jgi:hypothetical protein